MQTYAPPRDPTAVMGKRIGAAIIDMLIYVALGVILFAAFAESFDSSSNPCDDPDAPNMCFYAGDTTYFVEGGNATAVSLIPFLYLAGVSIVMQGLTGATPGKALFGLRTVRRDTGQVCGLGKAFIRWLLWIVDAFPYCFPLVGLVTSLASSGHKRVGDMAAGTAVVAKTDVGLPLDGGAGFDAGQQWAAPAGGGYAVPPPGGSPAPPPPGGYAAPPPGGFGAAPPPPTGDFEAAPAPTDPFAPSPPEPDSFAGDFGTAPPAEPSNIDSQPADLDPFTTPPPPDPDAFARDFGGPVEPEADEWGTTPASDPFGSQAEPAPSTDAFGVPEPSDPAPPVAPAAQPSAPADEPPTVQSNQPPVTTEPQWDVARNTYIQWDPVLAAWMQWDDVGQRWKHIDT